MINLVHFTPFFDIFMLFMKQFTFYQQFNGSSTNIKQ